MVQSSAEWRMNVHFSLFPPSSSARPPPRVPTRSTPRSPGSITIQRHRSSLAAFSGTHMEKTDKRGAMELRSMERAENRAGRRDKG